MQLVRQRSIWQGVSSLVGVILLLVLACSCAMSKGPSRVSINEDGVLIINGKKTLPIGFTSGPPINGKTPSGRNAYEELRDVGGTFTRTGIRGDQNENGMEETVWQREKLLMDNAAKYDMYCWPNLKGLSSLEEGNVKKEEMLRQVINSFKNHPGLLIWKNVDEAYWAKNPVEPMIRAYKVIKELDPYHPVVLSQAPRGTIEELIPYDTAADVLILDIYPISYPPGTHSLLANKELSMVGDWTRFIKEAAQGKPIWMVLQICWSGVHKPGKTLRYPTFAQERFMTYQALINGARGLIYFGGDLTQSMNERDARLGWNWTFWQRVLRPVLEEVGEGSPLYPALLEGDSKLPIKLTDANDVEYCVREVGRDIYILACKREGETVKVNFSGLPDWVTLGEVMYEAPRQVKVEAGEFTDWFAPFDVHVYHFKPM